PCPELDLTTNNIDRCQQDNDLEKDKEERIAQVDRIVQIGIEQRMTARLDGEQKGGNPLLPDTQGGGLHYDRSHRKLTEDGFESAAHLTAYAQKSIVVVVGKRHLPSGYGISREAGGDHEVAVYLFRLG